MPQPLPARGAVQLSTLVNIGGDGLQTGQEIDHVVAQGTPYGNDDDRDHREFAAEPVDGLLDEADGHEHLVHRAVVRVEDQVEHHAHDRDTDDGGHKEHGAVGHAAAQLHVDKVSQHERERQRNDELEEGVDEGVLQRVKEHFIVEQRLEVLQAAEIERAE